MTVYVYMVFAVLGLTAFFNPSRRRTRSMYILLSCLMMFVIMGFRDATLVGNDSSTSYLVSFRRLGDTSILEILSNRNDIYNIGFRVFMKICYDLFNGNYQVFIMVLAAINMYSFYHFIKRYAVSPILSICCYWGLLYFTFMFSAEKQALAMSILLFAFDAVIDRKLIRFLALTFLAGSIHFPALIFLPAYFLAQIELDRGYLWILTISLALTYLFRDRLLQIMMAAYGNDSESLSMEGISFFRNKVIVMIVIVLCALYLRPARKQNKVYKTLLLFMYMAIAFQTFCGYNNIFERLADYYFIFSVIFIPMIFDFSWKGIHRLDREAEFVIQKFAPLVVCAFAIVRFLFYLRGRPDNLVPYHFFFR